MADAFAGRYRLLELLDRGPLGETWRSRDEESGASVVLKLAGDEPVWGVPREIEVAELGLEHPNLVRALAYGRTEAGRAWLVLEHIHGPTVAELLRQRRLRPAEAAAVGAAIATALGALHGVGVLHRDVKPANVIVPAGPGRLRFTAARLLDLGIAELVEPANGLRSCRGERSGTPRYAAPEQLAGESQWPATDVWGLGMLLHAMLLGRRPSEDRRRLSLPRREVPRRLRRLTMRCLRPRPEARPSLAEVLRVLLELG